MRQLPHFPSKIPNEPPNLRRTFLPPNSAPREDEVAQLEWRGAALSNAAVDKFLREELTRSQAHCVRLETKDGGIIRKWTVHDVVRERFGIETLRLGDKERIAELLPELPLL